MIEVNASGQTMFDMMTWLATRFKGPSVIREAVDIVKDASELAERGRR